MWIQVVYKKHCQKARNISYIYLPSPQPLTLSNRLNLKCATLMCYSCILIRCSVSSVTAVFGSNQDYSNWQVVLCRWEKLDFAFTDFLSARPGIHLFLNRKLAIGICITYWFLGDNCRDKWQAWGNRYHSANLSCLFSLSSHSFGPRITPSERKGKWWTKRW